MTGTTDFENTLEERLTALVRAEQGRGTDPAGKGGYCVTYKFPQVNFDAVNVRNFSKPRGYQGEVLSILRYNITEAFDAIETLDIGEEGGAVDTVVNGATLPIIAVDLSDRATIVDGVTPIIPTLAQEMILTGTSVGTTGIADIAVTIRYFR